MDLPADRLGDAITRSLVGDWGGEAGAVSDTGGSGTKFDLGDNKLLSPDLEWVLVLVSKSVCTRNGSSAVEFNTLPV